MNENIKPLFLDSMKNLSCFSWSFVWNHLQAYIDFTQDELGAMDVEYQADSARKYQEWYAGRLGLAKEKTIEAGETKIEMVLIPPGCFWMGSPEDEEGRFNDESPRHRVLISKPFYMGKYQVTQRQWQVVMGDNPACFKESGLDAPVDWVSWQDFQEFCAKTGTALPTEAQWEYACRAGTTSPFNLGTTITPERVNYDGNCLSGGTSKGVYREKTVAVGSLANANGFGLYDMHGNVWEWCADWYGEGYYGSSPERDPVGPTIGSNRVTRGGCWFMPSCTCRSASRDRRRAGRCSITLGGRVIQEISENLKGLF
jgi:formylglycine-generating enzyme required for sulfatase activity